MSEFPAHWDFKAIGEFSSRVRRKNTGGECQDPMTISAVDGLVSQRDYFNKIVASKNTEGYTLLHRNDFAYNKSYSDGYPVGAARRLKAKDKGIVSPLYICFELDGEQIDLQFADHLFDSDWFVQAIFGIAKEGARSHGLLNIGIEEFFSAQLPVPPLPEQKKIAEILFGIDNLIAVTNSRMTSEQHLRAGLLEEMINEKRTFLKLDSVASRVSGHTPSKSNPEYWNGGIPWISLSDTAKLDKRYIGDTAKEISEQGIHNSSAVLHPAGLVVLSRDARVGCSAITTKKMAVSQHFIGWICSEQLLNRYLYYLLQKWKNKFEAIAMGSTIPTIGVPFFRDLGIPVPPIEEQRRIADTIESVDCHIEELRQRIDCLQNLKSAVASDLLSGRKRVSI